MGEGLWLCHKTFSSSFFIFFVAILLPTVHMERFSVPCRRHLTIRVGSVLQCPHLKLQEAGSIKVKQHYICQVEEFTKLLATVAT